MKTIAMLLLLFTACTDDEPELPLCVDLGCTGPLLCSGSKTCMCPVDGERIECRPGVPTDAGVD